MNWLSLMLKKWLGYQDYLLQVYLKASDDYPQAERMTSWSHFHWWPATPEKICLSLQVMGQFLSETITCMLSLPDYLRVSWIWSSSSPIWVQNSRMELSFEFSWNLFWNLAQFSPLCKIIFDHSTVPWVAFFCIFRQWQDYFIKKVNYYSMYNVLSYAHVIMWGLGRFVFMESGVHGWSWGGTTKETVSRCPRVCISALFLGVRTLNLRCNLQG